MNQTNTTAEPTATPTTTTDQTCRLSPARRAAVLDALLNACAVAQAMVDEHRAAPSTHRGYMIVPLGGDYYDIVAPNNVSIASTHTTDPNTIPAFIDDTLAARTTQHRRTRRPLGNMTVAEMNKQLV